MGSVDGRFSWLADRRALGLTGKQHGMGVGILARDDSVGNDGDEKSDEGSSVNVPLSEEARNALVHLVHDVVKEAHLGRRDGRSNARRVELLGSSSVEEYECWWKQNGKRLYVARMESSEG